MEGEHGALWQGRRPGRSSHRADLSFSSKTSSSPPKPSAVGSPRLSTCHLTPTLGRSPQSIMRQPTTEGLACVSFISILLMHRQRKPSRSLQRAVSSGLCLKDDSAALWRVVRASGARKWVCRCPREKCEWLQEQPRPGRLAGAELGSCQGPGSALLRSFKSLLPS